MLMAQNLRRATVDINKKTSPLIFAVHLDSAGPGGVIATLPKAGDIIFERRPGEPWQETLSGIAEVLRMEYNIMLAGNPYFRERRPQLLLAVNIDDLLSSGLEGHIKLVGGVE